MLSEQTTAWYEDWFDSPYYSTLYQHRDESEAQRFVDRLLLGLNPPKGARMLDLGCGKGRFSRNLAKKGFEVTGLDLSKNSIQFARQYETANLSFFTHDMRLPFRINYYDYIFSFFTSFGYFESDADHLRTLKSIRSGLKQDGIFVLDFFNARKVEEQLPRHEEIELDGIHFFIEKRREGGFVVKHIRFRDAGRDWHFTERVRLFHCDELLNLLNHAGLEKKSCFGDYDLNQFEESSSPRAILLAGKKQDLPWST